AVNAIVTWAEQVPLRHLRFATEKLLDHLWQSTLFAIAAGLLTLLCRRNHARLRYAIWMSASLKFFIPFALLTAIGSQLAWPHGLPELRQPILSAAIAPATWVVTSTKPTTPAPISHASDWRRLTLFGLWGCGCIAIVAMRIRLWNRVCRTL